MNDETLQGRTLSVSLTVNDLAKSLAWYTGVIGFSVAQKFERDEKLMAASLQSGEIRILLTQDDGAKGANRAKGEGFSFQITTDQPIDALAAAIKSRGGVLDTEPMDGRLGQRVFRLRDPDGFRLTVSSGVPGRDR